LGVRASAFESAGWGDLAAHTLEEVGFLIGDPYTVGDLKSPSAAERAAELTRR
jgi:hypothetical protein